MADGRKDGQTKGRTDEKTDRLTNRETDRQTDGHRQTDSLIVGRSNTQTDTILYGVRDVSIGALQTSVNIIFSRVYCTYYLIKYIFIQMINIEVIRK